jgi:hypothetical protein
MTDDNEHALDETSRVQRQTKAAIARMRRQADETRQVGESTLEQLHEQRKTVNRMNDETDRLHNNLDRTEKLQNKLSRWTLTFNRRKAERQVQKEVDASKVEQQRQSRDTRDGRSNLESRLEKAREKKELNAVMASVDNIDDEELSANPAAGNQVDWAVVPETSRSHGPSHRKNKKSQRSSKKSSAQNTHRLEEIEAEDQEIESALDGVGDQLDALLGLANQHAEELRTQTPALNQVYDSVESAHQRQAVATKRTKGFFTGRGRR